MMHDPVYAPYNDGEEEPAVAQSISSEKLSPESLMPTSALNTMSVAVLAEHCTRESSNYCNGEPSDDRYGLELFRRAVMQHDQEAWEWLQHCYSELVLSWLRWHPKHEPACYLDSKPNSVPQTFARFWLATTHNQQLAFSTLASALQYLRACTAQLLTHYGHTRVQKKYHCPSQALLENPSSKILETAASYGNS